MVNMANVQNGTQNKLSDGVGIIGFSNSNSSIDVSYYMSDRDRYKSEFNLWSKKTAQSTLEMCRVVYEAKKELDSQDFLKFCNEIGRKGEDATVRKYLKIGEKFDKFYQYAELLPNSWTSIYEITQLPNDVFEALVTTENSMANMSGDQIKLLMGKKPQESSKVAAQAIVAPNLPSQAEAFVPTTAQTATVEAVNGEASNSSSEKSESATASSDGAMLDTSESVIESIEAANAALIDAPSTDSDHVFAKRATNTMFEMVRAAATKTLEVEADEVFVPYEVSIRFNTKPSDEAVEALIESVVTIKSKYRLDIEIKSQVEHVM